MEHTTMEEIKIMIWGGEGVGKTALASRFAMDLYLDGEFNAEIMHGVLRRNFDVDGIPVALEIHHHHQSIPTDDSFTKEDLKTMDLMIKNSDGFILVYSVVAQSKFNTVAELVDKHISVVKATNEIPMIIVGNKYDLCNDGDSKSNMRVITRGQGQQMAENRKCGFYEVSAKTNYNVNEVFVDLIRRILKERKGRINSEKKRDRSCQVQ